MITALGLIIFVVMIYLGWYDRYKLQNQFFARYEDQKVNWDDELKDLTPPDHA